ncbi:MAG: Na+/H+ antiporter subunit E [Rickettsiales bacterium]
MLINKAKLAIVLFVFLQILTPTREVDSVFLLILICLFVAFIINKMKLGKVYSQSSIFSLKLICYISWLLKEIVISSLGVLKIILLNKKTSCRIDKFSVQKNDAIKTIYVNSITLTPGTIAINSDSNSIDVHSLTTGYKKSLDDGTMHNKIREIFND